MTAAVELQITDVAFGGKGVAHANGKAVFVPYVIDGETVSASITREHKKFLEAELESIVTASAHRVEPRCPYFGRCGGCVYQHIEYEYRNRITVHVRDGAVGFFRRESNKLLDIECCPIALNEVNAQLAELRGSRPRDGHYTLRAGAAARVFTQANDVVAAAMLDLVDRLLGSATGTLIDAYCGAGFFSKRLRGRFDKVIGIDWDQHAIAIAREDANENETYVAVDVETELGARLQSIAPASDGGNSAVIVDPPATGLSKMILETLIEHRPTQLVYVSCNPATLARDLVTLKQSFRIDSITPLDMFPQTAEIEVVAELSRAV